MRITIPRQTTLRSFSVAALPLPVLAARPSLRRSPARPELNAAFSCTFPQLTGIPAELCSPQPFQLLWLCRSPSGPRPPSGPRRAAQPGESTRRHGSPPGQSHCDLPRPLFKPPLHVSPPKYHDSSHPALHHPQRRHRAGAAPPGHGDRRSSPPRLRTFVTPLAS